MLAASSIMILNSLFKVLCETRISLLVILAFQEIDVVHKHNFNTKGPPSHEAMEGILLNLILRNFM